jgi:hypothetical protein
VSVAPDYVEPVVGWRMWYAVDDGSGTMLSSVIHRTLWPERAPLAAVCRRFRMPFWPFGRGRHDAPAAGCTCGIHAATMATMRAYLPDTFSRSDAIPVLGRVSLWGQVHEYERGWRASLAYPERLYVPVAELGTKRAARVVEDLRRYGVPVLPVGGTTADAVIEEVAYLVAA